MELNLLQTRGDPQTLGFQLARVTPHGSFPSRHHHLTLSLLSLSPSLFLCYPYIVTSLSSSAVTAMVTSLSSAVTVPPSLVSAVFTVTLPLPLVNVRDSLIHAVPPTLLAPRLGTCWHMGLTAWAPRASFVLLPSLPCPMATDTLLCQFPPNTSPTQHLIPRGPHLQPHSPTPGLSFPAGSGKG